MVEKLTIKYTILSEENLYDVYYMDYQNNILSSSLSINVDEVFKIANQYINNQELKCVQFFPTSHIDLSEV